MTVELGFNISKAKTLMGNIRDGFNGLESTITNSWPTLRSSMRSNWIGEDELSFENEFRLKVNKLYSNAGALANYAITVICDTTNAWDRFQSNNVLQGALYATETHQITDLSEYSVSPKEDILEYSPLEIGENQDRGLKNSNSLTTIRSAMDSFVKAVKGKCDGLFGNAKAGSAFYGEGQSTKLDSLLEAVEEDIGIVSTAVQDLSNALGDLASRSYSNQITAVGDAQTTNESNLTQKLDDELPQNTRWTSAS